MVGSLLFVVQIPALLRLAQDRCDAGDQASIGPKTSADDLDHLFEPELTECPRRRVLALWQRRRNRHKVAHECRYQLGCDGEIGLETVERPGVRLLLQDQQVGRWIAALVHQIPLQGVLQNLRLRNAMHFRHDLQTLGHGLGQIEGVALAHEENSRH